jgi:hypothetical protein
MTQSELVLRAKNQLEGKSPEFPCIETCHAIIEMGRELDLAKKELENVKKGVEYAKHEQNVQKSKNEKLETALEAVKKTVEDYKFINAVAFSFIRDMAAHEYDGKEAATAKRIFDLHKEDLGVKLIRCYTFNSADEALAKYSEWCKKNGVDEECKNLVDWLFSIS